MIKLNRGRKMITAMAVVMAAVMLLSGTTALASSAPSGDSYEPLEVTLPYRHVYTTTDTAVDSVFHYIIEATVGEGALPAEADSAGGFSYEGKTGSGTVSGNDTVYDANGSLTFTFTKPGEYTYHIKPDATQDSAKEHAERYTFETREYDVHFYVANATDGSLKLRLLTMTAENQDQDKVNEVLMETSYEWNPVVPPEPAELQLNVKKIMTGSALPAGAEYTFTFTVTAAAGTPLPATNPVSIKVSRSTPAADLEKTFGSMQYDEEGTYTYTVTESGSYPGMTPVEKTKTVTVTVTKAEGKLVVESVTGADADGTAYRVDFTNKYTPTGIEIPLGVKKIMTGSTLPDDAKYTFTFTLTAANGTPMPATTEVSMTVRKNTPAADLLGLFGNIRYTEAGTYVYTVKETMGGKYPGVTCVTPEKTVVVVIKDNNGALVVESITGATKDGTVYRAEITNNYSPGGPRIGDDTPVRQWMIVMLASGGLIAAVAAGTLLRKKKEE